MRNRIVVLAPLGAAALFAACSSADAGPASERPADDAGLADDAWVDASVPAPAERGLPCAVDALLSSRCHACHGSSDEGLPRLVTHDDLIGPAPSEPEVRLIDMALRRVRADRGRMPPAPNARLGDEQIAILQDWVDRDTPRGACGADTDGGQEAGAEAGTADAGDVDASLPGCTSGKVWRSLQTGPYMNPGRACIDCHLDNTGEPILHVGGTVYPTLHEPNLCYGVDGTMVDVKVVITDGNGQVISLPVGTTGNFSIPQMGTTLAFPLTAKVVRGAAERVMGASIASGDCNGCHTEQGASGAAGRITVP